MKSVPTKIKNNKYFLIKFSNENIQTNKTINKIKGILFPAITKTKKLIRMR